MMVCDFCDVDHKVTVPCIHMNGTSAGELAEQIDEAVKAVQDAVKAVVAAAPNNRDYYVYDRGQIGGDAQRRVDAQHRLRLGNLHAVLEELTEIRDHIHRVIDSKEEERARRRAEREAK